MKKIIVLLMLSSWQIGYSQEISKSERKELIAKSKQFKKDPAQLKALLGQTEVMKVRASKAEQELAKSKDEIALLQSNLSDMQQENQNLKATLGEERMALSKLPASATKGYVLPIEGVVFRVQIGGYRKRDLSSYIDNSQENIRLETTDTGIAEVTVGQFASYRKADELKKHLRAMGVKDAWVVPYKDGKRVLLKEVLDFVD